VQAGVAIRWDSSGDDGFTNVRLGEVAGLIIGTTS
jgi:hypothetical protein